MATGYEVVREELRGWDITVFQMETVNWICAPL